MVPNQSENGKYNLIWVESIGEYINNWFKRVTLQEIYLFHNYYHKPEKKGKLLPRSYSNSLSAEFGEEKCPIYLFNHKFMKLFINKNLRKLLQFLKLFAIAITTYKKLYQEWKKLILKK